MVFRKQDTNRNEKKSILQNYSPETKFGFIGFYTIRRILRKTLIIKAFQLAK